MTGISFADDLRRTVDRIRDALGRPGTGSIVVVGDVMLDRYVDGTSTRLSPEAPVPVVDVAAQIDRLGGAANVAAGLGRLGMSVVLVGMVGDDDGGARVRSLLAEDPEIDAHLVIDATRPTTTKERVRVDGRHIMRIDRESSAALDERGRAAVERATQDALDGAGLLVISDYAKGAVDAGLLASLTGRPGTLVDPKAPDVARYRGADVLTPNRREAITAASRIVGTGEPSLDESVRALHTRLPGTALVVTCGADGIVWSERGGEARHELRRQPSLARHVDDVTGAGDSVVCGLAAALASGADLADAVGVAAAVAAVAVESPGTAAPTWEQIDGLVAQLGRSSPTPS